MCMKRKIGCFILVLAVLSFVLIGILILHKDVRMNFIFAGMYELCGIDVSHYQGEIDWKKLEEQGLDFAFIKATEGSSYLDECFYDNWKAAEQTGLYIGAYHFFSFDSEGKKQADFYINTVGDLNGKLAPVIDVEYYGNKKSNPPEKSEVTKNLRELLNALEEYYQIKPVIYTTHTVYNDYIEGEFEDYPLWIRSVYCPPVFMFGNQWTFWQYTDTAILEGYEGAEKYIDMNVFRGTQEELEKLIVSSNEAAENMVL